MKVRALKSFCGSVTMRKGEVQDLDESPVLLDLLKYHFVIEERSDKDESQ